MLDLIEIYMRPQLLAMVLAGIGTFVTVLTVVMPLLHRDRMAERMKVMATERDAMRLARLTDLSKDAGGGRLRHQSKGFMQGIVDQMNLRQAFESEEIKDTLKMAGLRGQAPLTAYIFFRMFAPVIVGFLALAYLFGFSTLTYPPIVKFAMGLGAGYLGFYLPNMFLQNLISRRQQSIGQAFPDSLDMLLICVQSGMSI